MSDFKNLENIIRRISPKIRGIVRKIEKNEPLFDRDDLYQEILLHLWVDFKDGKLDSKTDSYILQGCYFYIKNYVRVNRMKINTVSIEEMKGKDEWSISEKREEIVNFEFLIEQIESSDIFNEREKKVLHMLLEGLTVREIGNELGVSHVMVLKIKRKIEMKIKKYFQDIKVTSMNGFLLV